MGHGIRNDVIIDFVLRDIEQLILVNAQRLSEVECNLELELCVSAQTRRSRM